MDPEKQPLLATRGELRCRRFRPLTTEEVLATQQEVSWRRLRFLLKFIFWGIITMFLSIIACILIQRPGCRSDLPSVPPVHLTFAPLISSGKFDGNDDGADTVFMS